MTYRLIDIDSLIIDLKLKISCKIFRYFDTSWLVHGLDMLWHTQYFEIQDRKRGHNIITRQ